MNKLEKLIKELCPEGVTLKKIEDISNDLFWIMPATPQYNDSENIPYITSKNLSKGKIDFSNCKHISEKDYKNISSSRPLQEGDVLISMIGRLGEIGIVRNRDLPFYGQNMYLVRLSFDIINIDFFYYYFDSLIMKKHFHSIKNNSGQGYLKAEHVNNILIPLPPLEIQIEIVRILDNFTELEAELEEELEEELEARTQQFEYYRNKLLDFSAGSVCVSKIDKLIKELCPDNVEYFEMCQVTAWDKKFNDVPREKQKKVIKYKYLLAKNLKDLEDENGDVKLLSTGNYDGFTTTAKSGEYLSEGEIVAIPWGGTAIIKYFKGKFVTADNRIATSLDTKKLNNKFLYYYMLSNQKTIQSFYRGSGIKHPSMKDVLSMLIPLPPLEIQNEIVKILDSFSKLVTSISEGLPAEIEARKQQYEYYRNKLLTFKERQ